MKVRAKQTYHVPVLLNEVLQNLRVTTGSWYVDATAGRGGHTREILIAGGNVVAIDQDYSAVNTLKVSFKKEIEAGRLIVIEGNFVHLSNYVKKLSLPIKGVLFDLGMSTFQIKESGRGFTFEKNEPLDMRMSRKLPTTAAEIVNKYSEGDLYEIFRKFGEEHLAREIAHAIFRARTVKQIRTTVELVSLIREIYNQARKNTHIHPATRVFQALRIVVNDELSVLKTALVDAIAVIEDGGRCLVISFHSLEDRIVKLLFREAVRMGEVVSVTAKPIVPSAFEIRTNPSARSAKLRVVQIV